jgi:hypothetical protein
MTITKDYLHFPGSATVEEVLRTYLDRQGQWWWLLISEIEGEYYVCSFGSFLPYLTGRTPHIVHNIGDCPVCSSIDPLLWRDTDALVEETLADAASCSRLVSDLPMARLPVIEAKDMEGLQIEFWLARQGLRAGGVTKNGLLCEVHILQVKGDLGGLPDF